MLIKVLGPGCARCQDLYAETRKALGLAGVEAQLLKVEKLDEIMEHGVMMTPALVINDEVKCAGRMPPAREIVT
jgi:small redox-active disulfide protein 2